MHHATNYTQPARAAENRSMTTPPVTGIPRRRLAGAAGTLLAFALLLGIPSSGWAQRVLVIDTVDIRVCENSDALIDCTSTSTSDYIGTYMVNLSTVPTGTVTVAVAVESDHPKPPTVNPESLTFTPATWADPQEVTVTGVDDKVDNPGGFRLTTIEHTATGGGFSTTKNVHVAVENDGDAAGIIDADGAMLSGTTVIVTEGGTNENGTESPSAPYSVGLNSEPTGTVTMSLKVGGKNPDAATVEPSSLTFTPDDWMVQTVTVTGVPDDTAIERMATITHTPTGGNYDNVSGEVMVTIRNLGPPADTDSVGVTYDPPILMIDEGGTGTYTIRLNSSPGTDKEVEVTLTIPVSRDVIEKTSLGHDKLTFTAGNWDIPQRVEVTVKYDPAVKSETARTAKITHAFTNNYSPDDELSVTAREKDKKGLSVSNKVLEFGEHSYRQYSVKLTSKPEASVEVTVTTNDVDSNVATIDKDGDDRPPLPLTLTFTDADWNEAQQVFVRGVDDAVRHPISRSMTITHSVAAQFPDPSGYDTSVDSVQVKVKITDHEDNPRIEILGFPPGSIPDASDASPFPSYMVRLSTVPSVAVIVTVEMESDKIGDGLSTSTNCGAPLLKKIYLAFPTGEALPEAQPVTICVGDTADNPGSSHDVTIAHTASGTIAKSGGEYNDVPAVRKRLKVIDDEDEKEDITRTLRISKKAGFSVQENGGTVEGYGSPVAYTVQLDSRDDRNPTVL